MVGGGVGYFRLMGLVSWCSGLKLYQSDRAVLGAGIGIGNSITVSMNGSM